MSPLGVWGQSGAIEWVSSWARTRPSAIPSRRGCWFAPRRFGFFRFFLHSVRWFRGSPRARSAAPSERKTERRSPSAPMATPIALGGNVPAVREFGIKSGRDYRRAPTPDETDADAAPLEGEDHFLLKPFPGFPAKEPIRVVKPHPERLRPVSRRQLEPGDGRDRLGGGGHAGRGDKTDEEEKGSESNAHAPDNAVFLRRFGFALNSKDCGSVLNSRSRESAELATCGGTRVSAGAPPGELPGEARG